MSRTTSEHPQTAQHAQVRGGAWAGAGCFVLWGIFPIYWKQMSSINAVELICHRMVWSLIFLICVLAWQRQLGVVMSALRNPRQVISSMASAILLTCNWLLFVWGVNTGHVMECSLGYFLIPLCNVAFGRMVFGETLRRFQWIAITLAAVGVGLLLWRLGRLPWIALGLAGSWSMYGVLKKKSALGSLTGLTVETILLVPLAIGWLVWLAAHGAGAIGHVSPLLHVYVLSAGIITAIPLLLFAYGTQRLRLTTMGILQFIGPTLQFLIGLLVYHEPFDTHQLGAFAFIWAGLILYVADSVRRSRERMAKA